MKNTKKFYIGGRYNPQLTNPYFYAYGQLTKKEAEAKTKVLYGSLSLREFDNESDYQKKIDTLILEGYKVTNKEKEAV